MTYSEEYHAFDEKSHDQAIDGVIKVLEDTKKRGGALPLALPLIIKLLAMGLPAVSAGAATGYNIYKGQKELKEAQRHNMAMEKAAASGSGMFYKDPRE